MTMTTIDDQVEACYEELEKQRREAEIEGLTHGLAYSGAQPVDFEDNTEASVVTNRRSHTERRRGTFRFRAIKGRPAFSQRTPLTKQENLDLMNDGKLPVNLHQRKLKRSERHQVRSIKARKVKVSLQRVAPTKGSAELVFG